MQRTRSADDKTLSFDGGVLNLACNFATSPKGRFNHKEIRACLEGGL